MISSKKISLIALILIVLVLVFTVGAMYYSYVSVNNNMIGVKEYSDIHSITYTDDDYYTDYSEASIAKITLNGNAAVSKSKNVSVEENSVTILGGGTYVLSGELSDGSIIVDSSDGAVVRLIFNNASVTSSDFSALYVKQAEKVIISAIKDTENYLTDGSSYNEEKLEDGKPTAALYSKDSVTLNGEGTLIVTGNYKDGIKVNDTLKVTQGTLKVNSVDDGINVNDAIAVLNTSLEITSGGDAVKCEYQTLDKGFIAFDGTNITITSDGDGVYASSAIYANNVISQIVSGGGSEDVQIISGGFGGGRGGFWFGNQQNQDTVSTKAIKAGNNLAIIGGKYNLDSKDDAIHSDGDISIEDAKIVISCGDDAIHAENNVDLLPQMLDISKCNEGIEGGYIVINGGEITIISADDGINAVGNNSSGGMGMPMMMHKENITDEDVYLTINGGNIRIETSGDGVDSNGAAKINGGNIEVYGPENSGNSSLDFQYGFIINGGNILAAGSSGMAETPSGSSSQNAIIYYLDASYDANSIITLCDSNGSKILLGTSTKKFDWVCLSSDLIKQGEEYSLYINDTKIATTAVSDIITTSGSKGRGSW